MLQSKANNNKTISIKINSTTETADAQYEIDQYRLNKKRELRTSQYDKYTKLFYGTPSEKEAVR